MITRNTVFLLAAVALLGACAATGPADDGFENSQESSDVGRVFSDDEDAGEQSHGNSKHDLGEHEPASAEQFDYEAYREWRAARDANSDEYRKFRLWQEFEAFQRWRESQRPE